MPEIECKLGCVIVYVDAPTEASAFYERTFGLRPEFAAPDGSYAQLDTGPTKLAFASPADKPHGQRVAYLRDPFGTLIELATPL